MITNANKWRFENDYQMAQKYRLPEEFVTDRFLVRRIVPSDAQAIFDGWNSDPEVTKYLTWKPHAELPQTLEAAERSHCEWEAGTAFPAVICLRDQPRELVGRVDARPAGHKVSYGWLIRRDHWGNGIASEVVRWAVDHALSHPLIFRTEASCDVMNGASARVMEKAGMTKEAFLQRYLLHPNISDVPRDAFLYSKVR
ncbi:GNAT family N-acetyltransferase [Rhizobium leguminosarum]|uniref:GNAT family N-acetyltransferase n=1 Tax=Rhizobium leguminosarum TaxID=384 RepID=UPI0032B2FBA4